jgi:hypothetical protein
MTLPGFNAEASSYSSGLQYLSAAVAQGTYIESSLRLAADSCVCTSPNCCPVTPPPTPCCPADRPICCGECRPRPDGTGLICEGQCIGRGELCP